jgi:hypothetical protein
MCSSFSVAQIHLVTVARVLDKETLMRGSVDVYREGAFDGTFTLRDIVSSSRGEGRNWCLNSIDLTVHGQCQH